MDKAVTKLSKESIKVTDKAKEFLTNFKLNLIRGGASSKALDLSYADSLELLVNYFKDDGVVYESIVRRIAKNV